jgi:hypothetical protein
VKNPKIEPFRRNTYTASTMAKLVFDNSDLLYKIYSFGDVAREKMAQIEFPENSICDVVDAYVDSEYCDRKESCFVLFLRDCYTVEQRRGFAKRLLRCQCCSRHTHYKTIPFKPADPVPESKKMETCYCPCRHYYRLLRRMD